MKVENKNIFVWIIIMLSAWLLFSVSFGALCGLFTGLKIAGPLAVEMSASGDIGDVKNEKDLTPDQRNAIEKKVMEELHKVNWWLWWPLLSTVAWLITSVFLGFMKVVKFNGGLIIITNIVSFFWHGKEWAPPGNILINACTILLALTVVHFVSSWISSKRIRA